MKVSVYYRLMAITQNLKSETQVDHMEDVQQTSCVIKSSSVYKTICCPHRSHYPCNNI